MLSVNETNQVAFCYSWLVSIKKIVYLIPLGLCIYQSVVAVQD